jgi:alcohol oxidase
MDSSGMANWFLSERQDTAPRYLHPLLQDGKHPNLQVLTETKVERVIFDDHKRAVGLVVLPNMDHLPLTGLCEQPRTSITAKKFVVVAAGALGAA